MSLPYLQPYLGLSNGLNTLHAAGGPGGAVGGWVELGRTTLGSASSTISVTGLSDKRYYMLLSDFQNPSGNEIAYYRLGNGSFDSGSNYSARESSDGGADGTVTSNTQAYINGAGHGSGIEHFDVTYIANYSSKEKLAIGHSVDQGASGAGTAPQRDEGVWKWANTSNPLDRIQRLTASAVTYASGSEVVVLGYDPADTHTNNFWEELASVQGTGSSTNLSSGTISAKKYIMIQAFLDGASTPAYGVRFNNDTGSNYAWRESRNGAADTTYTSSGSQQIIGSNAAPAYVVGFIINNSSNEKLCIWHINQGSLSGAAGAPNRREQVGKWAYTSGQITEIDIDSTVGNFSSDSIIKVWGAD